MNAEGEQPDATRTQCNPCRGSGRVVSNLGGEAHDVICPWCGGSGKFAPERDAQEHPSEGDGS